MKGFILVILAIIVAVLVAGGLMAHQIMNEEGIGIQEVGSKIVDKLLNKVNNVESSESSKTNTEGNIMKDVSDIVNEEIKFNAQNGEGYYREVTYKDGGFRQFDTETGELIGSSYDSDQDKLPTMD